MPMYVYAVILPDGTDGDTFEVLQSISEPPLTEHPETGQPVRRVITAPNAPKAWTDTHAKANLSDKNLERLGFTKYKRAGGGNYEKTAGSGPDVISAND
ncbi:FmdB family zinc ribbon protein [Tuwongella immobilis]|uniref:Putative regulatory protein FmdB zinc ribbon domain-containing protein n=1 Tax=Tuwongella immobilis TaxID=692036 RepID=A0A6C2YJC5_9BACT|nr:zinc ribbon domain-containing protein [Tuwongella immobilis]VIP01223.1 Uncharacterized protein OS=Planctomyces maris DSM 8797 GN=PM8797T_06912 PE=4 SV=1 [Tuwongella immobilis]VTR97872.1 Uncharacterized protein OS=Planctomyces maris DSM 8797 GN=PM8797T_06912 PE=4 SV=1 [Tuwongella immobilis]